MKEILKRVNEKVDSYYYVGDIDINNYYLKIELLPENTESDHIFIIFNTDIINFTKTDESFRSDLWSDNFNDIIIKNDESELITQLIDNSSRVYEEKDLKHYTVITSDTILDIVSLEDPIIYNVNKEYNKIFNYNENYETESDKNKIYSYMIGYKYPKTSQIIESMGINSKVPFDLIPLELINDGTREYESVYVVKGDLLEEKEMFLEGLVLEYIDVSNTEVDKEKIILEEPYFVLKLKGIELIEK